MNNPRLFGGYFSLFVEESMKSVEQALDACALMSFCVHIDAYATAGHVRCVLVLCHRMSPSLLYVMVCKGLLYHDFIIVISLFMTKRSRNYLLRGIRLISGSSASKSMFST